MANDAVVILAGGSSRRFRADKSHALLAGVPMLEWVARAAFAISERVVIAARPGQELPVVADLRRAEIALDNRLDAGPMAGLEAAFTSLGGGRAFVIGVDAPLLVPGLALAVLNNLDGPEVAVAVPVVGGRRQPLVAAYDVTISLPALSLALDRDERRILTVLEQLAVVEIPEVDLRKHDPGLRSFDNVNTPEALLAVEMRLRAASR